MESNARIYNPRTDMYVVLKNDHAKIINARTDSICMISFINDLNNNIRTSINILENIRTRITFKHRVDEIIQILYNTHGTLKVLKSSIIHTSNSNIEIDNILHSPMIILQRILDMSARMLYQHNIELSIHVPYSITNNFLIICTENNDIIMNSSMKTHSQIINEEVEEFEKNNGLLTEYI